MSTEYREVEKKVNRLHQLSLAAFMNATLLLGISGQVRMAQTTTQTSNPTSTYSPTTFYQIVYSPRRRA